MADTDLDNLTWFKADQNAENILLPTPQTQPASPPQQASSSNTRDNQPSNPQDNPEALPGLTPKDRLYLERTDAYQKIAEKIRQTGNDAVVLLQMQSKDGKEFFQTYDKDAEFIAEMLNRRTVTSTANKYISLSPHEVETIRNQIGTENLVVEEYAHKTPYTMRHETSGEAGRPHPPVTVTPSSRIEYIVSPIMRTNKVTQQMERVPGMFALTITADGISLDSKTLTRQERDLLNDHPSEITNIINHKFTNDLGSTTISFKQVHRPAVTDRQWQNLSLPNGITFDSLPRMYRNTVTGKYEMTATIDGMTIGPKTMARHDVNDFFDHALPA